MTISFTLPLLEQKPSTTQDMVFTVLTNTYPLSLIELQHALRKQYSKVISFQSVRKATLRLQAAGVLVKEGKKFSINKQWIRGLLNFGNSLQHQYLTKSKESKLAVGPNMSVYSLNSMTEIDLIWNDLIQDLFKDPKQPKYQVFSGMHFWFVLVNLAPETELVRQLRKHGVQVYMTCYGNTPIDKWTVRYYNDNGCHSILAPLPKDHSLGLAIGAFGDYIMQVQYPDELAQKLDGFFKKYTRIEDAKVAELAEITSEKVNLQLTVIKDPVLARNFRENALKLFQRPLRL